MIKEVLLVEITGKQRERHKQRCHNQPGDVHSF
jgi:hypothetical protein